MNIFNEYNSGIKTGIEINLFIDSDKQKLIEKRIITSFWKVNKEFQRGIWSKKS